MDIAETVLLKAFAEEHKNTHHEGGTSGNNDSGDEEDDARGHGGVRC